MEAFLASAGVVAIAEIGDKTQLLAILLATRFQRPLSVIAGIFAATMLNHAAAAWAGGALAGLFSPRVLAWVLALSFIAMAIWVLFPDKADESQAPRAASSGAAFMTTAIAFFFVEMGDKTQVATIALGARYDDVLLVAAGTTLGMMIANVPAVLLGEAATRVAPPHLIRLASAAIFAALAVLAVWAALSL